MYYLDRKTFDETKQLEEDIQDKRKKFFSIMASGKSMSQLQKECEQSLFTDKMQKEIYTKVGKTTYCGGFCHR